MFTSRDVKFNEVFEDVTKSSIVPQVSIYDHESPNNFEIAEISKETSIIVEESSPPPKTKSIQDIYQRTQQINYSLMTTIMKINYP